MNDLPAWNRLQSDGQLQELEWWINGRISRERNRMQLPPLLRPDPKNAFSRVCIPSTFLRVRGENRCMLLASMLENCVVDGCTYVRMLFYDDDQSAGRIEQAEWRQEGRLVRERGPVMIHDPYNCGETDIFWTYPIKTLSIDECGDKYDVITADEQENWESEPDERKRPLGLSVLRRKMLKTRPFVMQ